MSFNPTKEQELAINAKGNILVSAAAGSGKTAVLVERVINKLCSKENPVMADKLLIVTFTNAAAAEMRTRIEKRLDEEIFKNPTDISLLMQKHRISSAKICTIDSFCIDLVRENFEILDISPDFKISDANSLKVIDQAVLSSIITRYLEEENPVFLDLLDIIGSEYDEKSFLEIVLNLYNYSRQLPFPEKWFDMLSEFYDNGIFNSNSVWWNYAFEKAKSVINSAIGSMNVAIELLNVDEKATNSYFSSFVEAKEKFEEIKELCDTNDWNKLYYGLENFPKFSLPTVRGFNDINEINSAKDIYKYTTGKAVENLRKIFYANTDFINSQYEYLYKPLCLLSDILKEFSDKLFEEYKGKNVFTFHNTEHLALKLLTDTENNELLDCYEEVMVDEYQDTNDLQDMLFYVLSGREKRLFVVGDIKQSIYGFRGANPNNFLAKKNRYIPILESNEDEPQKIILGNNFRCSPKSCEFINFFFKIFMSEETGKIIYNDEEKLIPSAVFPETSTLPTAMHIIETRGSKESKIVTEARHIANYILNTINEGETVKVDDNTLRRAKFSDFTILLRSANSKAPIIARELKSYGIPVNYSSENFCESTEIVTFLSLLSVINNPDSDINLLCVMMSPIFNFTPDEMAVLRSKKRNGSLYSCVIFASSNGDKKAIEFLETLKKYRLYEISNTLSNLINLLLLETGYLDIVSALKGGEKKKNNLLLLSQYAVSYSKDNDPSISGFVKFIQSMENTSIKPSNSGGNAVKIMSIHASKGLQFPICIIADTASDFVDHEAHDSTLFSTDLGIGFKYFYENLKTKLTTVAREVILDNYRSLRLEEELRLLYVAMTRTQDRLLFTATISDTQKKAESIKTLLISANNNVNRYVFSRTKSYCDWLFLSLMLHQDGKLLRGNGCSILVSDDKSRINLKLIPFENILTNTENKSTPEIIEFKNIYNLIAENLAYDYPFNDILSVESKASVSKLSHSAQSNNYAFSYTPAFMQSNNITPTQRGTAMHKVMQFFDFEKHNSPEKELERLYEWQYISEKEYESIDISLIKDFFSSNVFKRIMNAKRVEREMRFLTEVPAVKIDDSLGEKFSEETVIVQGAVDVCFVEEDGLVILDFKTDRVLEPEILAETYAEQLNIYSAACEKIFEMPVKEKIIYSFSLSKEIKV